MGKGDRPGPGLVVEPPVETRATGRTSQTLPADMVDAANRRVGFIAPLYAATFFMAGIFPALIRSAPARAEYLSDATHWLPAATSIAIATVVALLMRSNLGRAVKGHIGLAFEVVGSFGIAAAEYHDITAGINYDAFGFGGFGLSWVTAWVMLFTIAVPTPPRKALGAALLSVSAVPLVFAANAAWGNNTVSMTGKEFFFALVFANLLVVGMAYAGAHIVYGMGRAVREAREMGSYRLVELLGKGGMGEVWRAEHRALARPAAIKLIRPEVLRGRGAEGEMVLRRRFEREAYATAMLRSPHTIQLYDFGVTDDATFYYVMELLDGFDLDELVKEFGPIPPERSTHLLHQLADSLAEAHDAGLIHRDLKPANVFTCRLGPEFDFVKVLDFGMVKPTHAPETAVKLTAEHSTGGTPAFMSPEQALGEPNIDARSDVYSVGCIGYWLLTGELVFEGRSPVEVMMQHVQEDPGPPSQRSELDVPPELDDALLRCLAKKREERPQTAEELQRLLAGIPFHEAWTRERARKWWDAHRASRAPVADVSLVDSARADRIAFP